MKNNQFEVVAEYIKGFCLLLLKRLQIINNELIMLNNFELKGHTEKDKRTKVKNPKMRFSYTRSDLTNALNSTFIRMENSLSNLRSKKSNSLSFQQSSLQKSKENKINEINISPDQRMAEFGDQDFYMNQDLHEINRMEEEVENNLKIVQENHNLLLPDTNINTIQEENTSFELFNFSGDFKKNLQNTRIDLSRSRLLIVRKCPRVDKNKGRGSWAQNEETEESCGYAEKAGENQ